MNFLGFGCNKISRIFENKGRMKWVGKEEENVGPKAHHSSFDDDQLMKL